MFQFYLKAFLEKRSQRSILLKSASKGAVRLYFQNSQKQSPLEPDDMFIENNNSQDYHRSLSLLCYMFNSTLFIKNLLQKSWRTTTLINSAPKIKFSGFSKESSYCSGR